METMFPPIVDLNDNNCKSNYHDYPGIDDDHASIRYAVANYDFVMGNDHRECLYFLPDFGCVEPSILFDMSDSCLMLPSLEETLETIDTQYPGSCEEFQENTDNSRFYVVNHHIPSLQADDDCANPEETDADYFDPQLFLRNIPELSDYRSSLLPGLQPEETCEKKHVTLVLDLDETLIHSSMKPCDNVDFTIQVFFNMKEHTVYVRERPFLRPFLERVAGMFEIIVFTASERVYAEPLLDKLDPEKKFFSRCAFRESCILSDGSFTKDLTVLGIDLAKVAIIDNSPQVFRLQVNNGIPIKSWYDDPSDRALIALLPLLETLVDVEDVRPILARTLSA